MNFSYCFINSSDFLILSIVVWISVSPILYLNTEALFDYYLFLNLKWPFSSLCFLSEFMLLFMFILIFFAFSIIEGFDLLVSSFCYLIWIGGLLWAYEIVFLFLYYGNTAGLKLIWLTFCYSIVRFWLR